MINVEGDYDEIVKSIFSEALGYYSSRGEQVMVGDEHIRLNAGLFSVINDHGYDECPACIGGRIHNSMVTKFDRMKVSVIGENFLIDDPAHTHKIRF